MPIIVTAAEFAAAIAKRIAEDILLVELAAYDACLAGVRDAVRITNKERAVDQGLYKLSWAASRVPHGGELRNGAPYASIIEYGRRPNRPGPPLDPILGWVRRKFFLTGKCKENEIYGIAVAIRRHIHYRGTKPRRIMGQVFPILEGRFDAAAKRQLRRRR